MRLLSRLFALGLLLAPVTALAQSSDPAWLDDLADQLAREKQCEASVWINIREGELAGRKTFEARVRCTDGRYFDGARTEPENEFTIAACEIQSC